MRVTCPSCGVKVPARNVDLQKMVGKCDQCDEVFPVDAGDHRGVTKRARTPRPASIVVVQTPGNETEGSYRDAPSSTSGSLVLTRKWFSPVALFLLFFSVFWDAFLVFWYRTVLSASHVDLVMVFFPLMHVAAGVGITYYTLTMFVNRTVLTVADGRLRVKHGPLPWPGGCDAPAAEVSQLFVRRIVTRSKNGPQTSFALCADVGGTAQDLVKGLGSRDEAKFMEEEIEIFLKIVDDARGEQS